MPIALDLSGRVGEENRDKMREAARQAYAQRDFGAVTFSGISKAAGFTYPVAGNNFDTIEDLFAQVFSATSDAETQAVGQCFNAAATAIAEFSYDVAQEKLQEAADGLIAFYSAPCRIRSNANAYRHFYAPLQKAYAEAFDRRLEAALKAAPAFLSCVDWERPGLLAAIEAKAQFIAAPFATIDLNDERQKLALMLRNAVADEPDYVNQDWKDAEPPEDDEATVDQEPEYQEVIELDIPL